LKGTKQLRLFNPIHMSEERQRQSQEVLQGNLKTSRAWLVKENFFEFWSQANRGQGAGYFKQCIVGTIALYDAEGERLETIYLGRAPELGKAEFLARLDAERQSVCKRYPDARRAGLGDGARDYEPWLAARTDWQFLDFYHASGYLAGAAPGLRRKPGERAQWLEEACHALKHESGAAQRLAGELATQAQAGSRTRGATEALEAASGYFAHNAGHTHLNFGKQYNHYNLYEAY
jgi:hypothetical protein